MNSQGDFDRRFIEKTTLDVVPETDISDQTKWHIIIPPLPGYVFHTKYGAVSVFGERTVDGAFSGRMPYKVFLVTPVYPLFDPEHGYNEPKELKPVFYEVSQKAFLPHGRTYELFIFVHRQITRLEYNNEDPGSSNIELSCIEDMKRNGRGLKTSLFQLVSSKNEKDRQAMEIFLRSYPSWSMQVGIYRTYLNFSEPTRQANYVNETKYIPVNIKTSPGVGTTDIRSLPPVSKQLDSVVTPDYLYDPTAVAIPDPNKAVEEQGEDQESQSVAGREGGIDFQETIRQKIQMGIGQSITFISSSRSHREHVVRSAPRSFEWIRRQIKQK